MAKLNQIKQIGMAVLIGATHFISCKQPQKLKKDNIVVYQLLPRLFGNTVTANIPYGTIEQNGCGKFNDITDKALDGLKEYWANKGVDGFRCDVAEMVPVEFWSWVIPQVKKVNPSIIFLGEAYNPKVYAQYLNEGKFDYLYDKVGLYDALKRLIRNEEHANVKDINNIWQKQTSGFDHKMLRFLENHDEERIASKGFAGDAKLAFPAMVVSATLGKGPVMLYFGQEVGEPGAGVEGFGEDDNRTTIFDYWGVPNHQRWVNNGHFDGAKLNVEEAETRRFYKKLMQIRAVSEAITDGEILEIPLGTTKKVYAFVRYSANQRLLVLANFDREKVFNQSVELPTTLIKNKPLNKAVDLLSDTSVEIKEGKINIQLLPVSAQIIQF